MKYVRGSIDGRSFSAIVDGSDYLVLSGEPWQEGAAPTGERLPSAGVSVLSPVERPGKILCVGRNYRAHAEEFGNEAPSEPQLFFKPASAIIGPDDEIVRPHQSARTDFEGEMAVVIGRTARNVSASDALDFVFGYTVANDVTARDLQKTDLQWARAKGFDTFCPLGPGIETEFDPTTAHLQSRRNGELTQDGPLADMIHGVPEIIAYASEAFTLEPGDVILTGTLAGVGPFEAGDVIEITIEGLGTLRNRVRDEPPR